MTEDTPRQIELRLQRLRDELDELCGAPDFVDQVLAIVRPDTGPLCPVCRGPLDVAHDDPEWDAVCADCCIDCRAWVPGGWFDLPGHGPGVIVSVDKMGVCRFLVRHFGSGPLTFDVRYPRGYRACQRPGWAVDLGVLLSGERTLFGVS